MFYNMFFCFCHQASRTIPANNLIFNILTVVTQSLRNTAN